MRATLLFIIYEIEIFWLTLLINFLETIERGLIVSFKLLIHLANIETYARLFSLLHENYSIVRNRLRRIHLFHYEKSKKAVALHCFCHPGKYESMYTIKKVTVKVQKAKIEIVFKTIE